MKTAGQLVYGTCVALVHRTAKRRRPEDGDIDAGQRAIAAILRGPSGSGKSDLALRFVLETPASLNAALVSDDQVCVARTGERLLASPPAAIAGKIEVRGVGIVSIPHVEQAELRLAVNLCHPDDVPRLPLIGEETEDIQGIAVAVLHLAPFEASAPLKLALALSIIAKRGLPGFRKK